MSETPQPTSDQCSLATHTAAAIAAAVAADLAGTERLGENGPTAAIVVLIEIVVYQQVENYFLSPRISAKTIELNAGVAFGAALAGGAVGGFAGAFFALPVAATIQAFISEYSKSYEVEESALTQVDRRPPAQPKPEGRRFWRRSKSGTPLSGEEDAERQDVYPSDAH